MTAAAHALRALVMLSDWTVKTTAILFVAWVATLLLRRSAAARHLTWLAAVAVVLVLPLLGLFVPGRPVISLAGAEPVMDGAPQPAAAGEEALIAGVLGVWGAGAAAVALHTGLGLLAAASLRRRSVTGTSRSCDRSAFSERLGLTRSWELRTSVATRPRTAMTWGVLRPTVLMPECSASWTRERFESVLVHELAHVRRWDSASQLLATAVCALHWFNPAVWLAARAMRLEAELAADDAVLRFGVRPSEYATCLLELAAEMGPRGRPRASAGVSVMGRARLETRIRSIVDPENRYHGVGLRERLLVAAVGLVAAFTLAVFRPVVSASHESGALDPGGGASPAREAPGVEAASPDQRASRASPDRRPRGSRRSPAGRSRPSADMLGSEPDHSGVPATPSPDVLSSSDREAGDPAPSRSADMLPDPASHP